MALSFVLDTSVVKRLGRPEVREVVEPLALGGQSDDLSAEPPLASGWRLADSLRPH